MCGRSERMQFTVILKLYDVNVEYSMFSVDKKNQLDVYLL